MSQEASGRPWSLIWVAGAGVIGTSERALKTEAEVFEGFLDDVADGPLQMAAPSSFFFASSAGGVYAGGSPAPFTERSAVVPL
ncbi:MAG TPA: NAD(P)-dependent oxidoreductase, partial [Mycobacteriales bacterium]|nr:NAD(P)-dependent oxidoreductase [Mycobacteriales bacterium]